MDSEKYVEEAFQYCKADLIRTLIHREGFERLSPQGRAQVSAALRFLFRVIWKRDVTIARRNVKRLQYKSGSSARHHVQEDEEGIVSVITALKRAAVTWACSF